MSKRFLIVFAAAAAMAGPALASPPPSGALAALPDFPPDAEPGACYARMRTDRQSGAPAEQGVWTLKRGHGPEAVWSYSEPGAPRDTPASGYHWVRVLCEDGRTPFVSDGRLAGGPGTGTTGVGLEPPPPPMAAPPPPPPPPPPPGVFAEPPVMPHPPMVMAHPPHGGPGLVPPFMAPPPWAVAQAPPPVSPPRWFGDRFLHWAGKRPAVW